MTPAEKAQFWEQTIRAVQGMDPRFMKAVVTALVLRHGKLVTCENGCCTYPLHVITVEELFNVVEHYNLALRPGEDQYTLELMALPKEGHHDKPE